MPVLQVGLVGSSNLIEKSMPVQQISNSYYKQVYKYIQRWINKYQLHWPVTANQRSIETEPVSKFSKNIFKNIF